MTMTSLTSPVTQSDSPFAIETRDLDIYYSAFRAVKSVDLQVVPNKITAIIGPSGCGKSTVLRAFNRMNDFIPGVRVDALRILSEGHIRCLGLAILLAKAKSIQSPLVVFDDAINANKSVRAIAIGFMIEEPAIIYIDEIYFLV